jgi:hypothetical protein
LGCSRRKCKVTLSESVRFSRMTCQGNRGRTWSASSPDLSPFCPKSMEPLASAQDAYERRLQHYARTWTSTRSSTGRSAGLLMSSSSENPTMTLTLDMLLVSPGRLNFHLEEPSAAMRDDQEMASHLLRNKEDDLRSSHRSVVFFNTFHVIDADSEQRSDCRKRAIFALMYLAIELLSQK